MLWGKSMRQEMVWLNESLGQCKAQAFILKNHIPLRLLGCFLCCSPRKKSHPDLPHFLFSYALQAGASRDSYTDRTWMACSEAFEQKGAICINETPCLTEWPNPKCDVQGAMFTWKRSVQVVLMCLRCSAFLLATWIKSKRASLSRVQLTKNHEIALISQLTGTRFREI